MNERAFCKEKYKFLSEGIVSFKNSCTFATHLRKTGAANILVPWMSGLVSGLQNRARRFESARNLQNKKRAYSVPWMSGLVSGLQNRARRFESARNLQTTRCTLSSVGRATDS